MHTETVVQKADLARFKQSAILLYVPSVQLDIIRHPGATINSLTDKLNDIDIWSRRYDSIILCIGGNDLSRLSVDEVFSKLCDLARRFRTQTTFLTVENYVEDFTLPRYFPTVRKEEKTKIKIKLRSGLYILKISTK